MSSEESGEEGQAKGCECLNVLSQGFCLQKIEIFLAKKGGQTGMKGEVLESKTLFSLSGGSTFSCSTRR